MKKTQFDSEILILNDRYVLLNEVVSLPPDAIVELDLGCGTGDMAVGVAALYPERVVFAADVMLGRLRKVARKAHRAQVENVKFLRVEARHLCSLILPDACLDRIHILCPDPWPKTRHKGHRLMSSDFMMQIHRILKPGGILHFATDDLPYLESSVKNLRSSGLFEEKTDGQPIADVRHITTEFERQWTAQGKPVIHTAWQKKTWIPFQN